VRTVEGVRWQTESLVSHVDTSAATLFVPAAKICTAGALVCTSKQWMSRGAHHDIPFFGPETPSASSDACTEHKPAGSKFVSCLAVDCASKKLYGPCPRGPTVRADVHFGIECV
jgi:hypothetical protein